MSSVAAMKSLLRPRPACSPGGVLRRKCDCGLHSAGAKCGECDKKDRKVQRQKGIGPESAGLPPIVHEVLRSPGHPLDEKIRAFMEPRFDHDFSGVRVHTDPKAAESVRAVNALAYTVGRNMVFGGGQYVPSSAAGRRLLSHELTHVVQQSGTRQAPSGQLEIGRQDDHLEQAAERAAREVPLSPARDSAKVDGSSANPLGNVYHGYLLQRQPDSTLDENARRIITLAQDSNRSLETRASEVVRAIIDQYYPSDASKVRRIVYRAQEPGLATTYEGTGVSTVGIITAGRYFVENTNQAHFARRIAQVRHEIQHIEQHRAGMGGAARSDEREFLAFYDEALFQELPHTGRITHSTRVSVIDVALGYYFCLSQQMQEDNASRRRELLTRRTNEVARSGRAAELGQPPTTCTRPAPAQSTPSQRQGAATGGSQPSPTPRVSVQIPISPLNFQFPFSGSTTPGTMHSNFLDQAYQPNIALGVVHSWRRNAAGRGWDLGGFVQGGTNLAIGSSLPTTGPMGTGTPRALTGVGIQGYVQPAFVIFTIDVGGDRSFQGAVFTQVGGGFLFSDIPGLQGWSISGQVGPQLSLDLVPNRLQLTGSASMGYSVNFPSRPNPGDPSVQPSPFWGFNIGIQLVLPVSYYPPAQTQSSRGR